MKRTVFIMFCVLITSALTAQNTDVKHRCRVILDNDFGGDPDGLVQLAHQLMSPAAEIKAIIGSGQYPGYPPDRDPVGSAVEEVRKLMSLMGMNDQYPVYKGSNERMTIDKPADSEGARAIIAESMRTDTDLPLFVLCGGSLTTIASAWLIEPEIADKLTVIWIGGSENIGAAGATEHNLNISIPAAQIIFNQSEVPVWQIPMETYRTAVMSLAEMKTMLASQGEVGNYLYDKVIGVIEHLGPYLNYADTYVMGDSPLVLLSSLQPFYNQEATSCQYIIRKAPTITDEGQLIDNPEGKDIRIYTAIDSHLMLDDFIAKITLLHQDLMAK